jgi:hypothetical protein
MPESYQRFSFRLLASGAFTLAIAAIFMIGFELGGGEDVSAPCERSAVPESLQAHLVKERDTLRALLAESERQRAGLERAAQVDKEASRAISEELKKAQDARLELDRELAYLKRLVQTGGQGAIQVYDMRLAPGSKPSEARYSFTITQLIQGFGRTSGKVRLSIEGIRGEKRTSLGLRELPFADPRTLTMDFEHFQNLQGVVEIPDGFIPQSIVVDIQPSSGRLLATSASFPWELTAPQAGAD